MIIRQRKAGCIHAAYPNGCEADVLVRELGPDGQLVENNVIADSDYIEIDLRRAE